VRAIRERSGGELVGTLSGHLHVDWCISKFYVNDVSAEDENAIVRRCPTEISFPMKPYTWCDGSICRAQNCTLPEHEQQKKGSHHAK
jgi:hypothetical protein